MAPMKRKRNSGIAPQVEVAKKPKSEDERKPDLSKIAETLTDSDPYSDSDTGSESGADDGVSWPSDEDEYISDQVGAGASNTSKGFKSKQVEAIDQDDGEGQWDGLDGETDGGVKIHPQEHKTSRQNQNGVDKDRLVSSREAHAQQKARAQERKAAKPNAEAISQCKSIWERLRQRKVEKEERKKLIDQLFQVIRGQVKDLVFKHDSVRVIETGLKYGNQQQKKLVAEDLKGEYKRLSESKYGKFLVGKLLSYGDKSIRDLVIPEFYGHVKQMMKHPEAAWILDDVYRGAATRNQKDSLLREWYGPEFAIFKMPMDADATSDLPTLLAANPEKKSPIMRHLHDFINILVQKKTTAYTMLHDAMLQYYRALSPGSEDHTNFLELLKSDEENDLLKNLAFTSSGSRLICLALAHTDAKNRKLLLRAFKGTIHLMTYDPHAHQILLTAFDVIDDTVLTSKSILTELTMRDSPETSTRESELLNQLNHKIARATLLYLSAANSKAYLPSSDLELLDEIDKIRETTSKKNPATRRQELLAQLDPPLLDLIAARTRDVVSTSYGCQFVTETILSAPTACVVQRTAAIKSLVALVKESESGAAGDSADEQRKQMQQPYASRMLKNLVQAGRYDGALCKVVPCEPELGFREALWEEVLKGRNGAGGGSLLDWALGTHWLLVVTMVEAEGWEGREQVVKALRDGRKRLQAAAQTGGDKGPGQRARTLLEKI